MKVLLHSILIPAFGQGGTTAIVGDDEAVPVEGSADPAEPCLKHIHNMIGSSDSVKDPPGDTSAEPWRDPSLVQTKVAYRYSHCAMALEWDQDLANEALVRAKCFGNNCSRDAPPEVAYLDYTRYPLMYTNPEGTTLAAKGGGNRAMKKDLCYASSQWYLDARFEEGFSTTDEMIEKLKSMPDGEEKTRREMFAKLVWTGAVKIGCAWASNPATQDWVPDQKVLTEAEQRTTVGKVVCLIAGDAIGPGDKGTENYGFWRSFVKPGGFDTAAERKDCGDVKNYREPDLTKDFDSPEDAYVKTVNKFRALMCVNPLKYDGNTERQAQLKKFTECYKRMDNLQSNECRNELPDLDENGNYNYSVVSRKIECPPEYSKYGCGKHWENDLLQNTHAIASWMQFTTKIMKDGKPDKAEWEAQSGPFAAMTPDQRNDPDFQIYSRFTTLMYDTAQTIQCAKADPQKFDNSEHTQKVYMVCTIAPGVAHPAKVAEWKDHVFNGKCAAEQGTA